MATEVLLQLQEEPMICPACKSDNEMAYSALIHGFVCLEPACGLELDMELVDVETLLAATETPAEVQAVEELVYA